MKKVCLTKIALTALLVTSATVIYAQSQGPVTPVKVGSVILNLGIGAGADYQNTYYNSSFGTKAALEFGLWQAGPGVITLGGEIGGSASNGGYYTDYKSHTFIIAARSAWHYGWQVRGLDTYGGVSAGLGFRHEEYDDGNGPYSHNDVIAVPGIFIGASYFVTPHFGFNAEAGYDITNIQAGVIFKLE
jgi:hypothetical protein